jgi:hypothetical protein
MRRRQIASYARISGMELWALLAGFASGAGFALLAGAITVRSGVSEPARGSWMLFGLGGILLGGGLMQQDSGIASSVAGAGAGVIAGAAFLVWWATRLTKKRDEAAVALADDLGLAYSDDSDPGLADMVRSLQPGKAAPFSPSARIERVLTGERHGVQVKLFEYYFEIDVGIGNAPPSQRNFVCASAEADTGAAVLWIRPKRDGSLISSLFRGPHVNFADDGFNHHFVVQSDDADTARSLLGRRIRQWLVENGRKMSFLVGQGMVLGMADRDTRPAKDVLDTVVALRHHVTPDAVTPSRHGRVVHMARARGVGPARASAESQVSVGLLIAVIAPIALFVGFLLFAYFACATGNGCL